MNLAHLHVGVRDLSAAIAWFETVLRLECGFQKDDMASIPLGDQTLILDRAARDSDATLALESADCDGDYATFVRRGASATGAPEDQPWGARCAYLKGPGALTIELETRMKLT